MRSILVEIGPVSIYSYGVMITLGVALSVFLMLRELRPVPDGAGRSPEPLCNASTLYDLVFVTLGTGLAGARVYYVLQNWDSYRTELWKVFALWEGGLIFYGGLLASVMGLSVFLRLKKIPVLAGLDFLIPYVALSQAFGRVGCFLNGCCYGKFCPFPWAVSFPEGPEHVHPTQLYEAFFLAVLFFVLRDRYRKRRFPGQTFVFYLILYGLGRFLIEFFRAHNPAFWIFTWNQWISAAVVATGAFFLLGPGPDTVSGPGPTKYERR